MKKNHENLNFSDYKGIIFTSANAIKFLNSKLIDKKINCFCVGNTTEKKLEVLVFKIYFLQMAMLSNLKELIYRILIFRWEITLCKWGNYF